MIKNKKINIKIQEKKIMKIVKTAFMQPTKPT